MPLPRIRIRTRTLLALIALVAIAFATESTRRRRIYFREKAEFHRLEEERIREGEDWSREHEVFLVDHIKFARSHGMDVQEVRADAKQTHERVAQLATLVAYHACMRRKYVRAAAQPWFLVPPDPPMPPDPFAYTQEEWDDLRRTYSWLPAEPPELPSGP